MRYQSRTVGGPDLLHRVELWWLALLVGIETIGVVSYFAFTTAEVQSLRYVIYPFVWINVGILAVLVATPPRSSRRSRLVAAAVATVYLAVLGLLSGLITVDVGTLVGTSHDHAHAHLHGLQLTMTTPGWGPRVGYAGSFVSVNLVPFRVIGYLALSYLVYVAVADVASAAVSGVLGLGSCLSCLPILGSLSAGVAGGTGVVTTLAALSVDLSTAVFVASVLLLTFRPGISGES